MKKKELIQKIKEITKEWGGFTTAEVEADSSPCTGSLGGTTQLLEQFYPDVAIAICYDSNDDEVDESNIAYENLSVDILKEILELAKKWEEVCIEEFYEHFSYIDEKGKALDDDFNEWRDEKGECFYVPKKDWKLFIKVKS